MPPKFQVVIDAHDPVRLARFWADTLGYQPEPVPPGFGSWRQYWVRVGIPELERFDGKDSIVDPSGHGPRIWFREDAEPKTCKNRLHFDVRVGGGIEVPLSLRKERIEGEVLRLERLGATRLETLESTGSDHYAVAMADPEGNEFDVN